MTTTPALGADKATDEYRYFTAVYRIPQKHAAEFATECCESKYWSAASWSHALDERDAARAHLAAVPASEPVRLMNFGADGPAQWSGAHNACDLTKSVTTTYSNSAQIAAAPAPVSGMPDLADFANKVKIWSREIVRLVGVAEKVHGGSSGALESLFETADYMARQAADVERLLNPAGETK